MPHLRKAWDVVCNAMTGFKFNILAILFCLIGILGNSQSLKTIDSLENTYQICLNQGQYMLGCTKTFYYQMDSLLNLRYNILLSQCDEKQKKTLATEQFMWFKKRDRQFILNRQKVAKDAKVNNYEDGQDEKTLLLDKNAKFIKRRVVELFKRKVTDYS